MCTATVKGVQGETPLANSGRPDVEFEQFSWVELGTNLYSPCCTLYVSLTSLLNSGKDTSYSSLVLRQKVSATGLT
jgi:hypothetical protein